MILKSESRKQLRLPKVDLTSLSPFDMSIKELIDAHRVEVGIFSSALLELFLSRSPTTIIVGTDIDGNLSCKRSSQTYKFGQKDGS